MAATALTTAVGDADVSYTERQYPILRRYHVGKHPLLREASSNKLEPTPEFKKMMIGKILQRVGQGNAPDGIDPNTIKKWQDKKRLEALSTDCDVWYARDFKNFLYGKSPFNGSEQLVPWGAKNLLHVDGVLKYLQEASAMRSDYGRKLLHLSMFPPTTLYESELYYKYIVQHFGVYRRQQAHPSASFWGAGAGDPKHNVPAYMTIDGMLDFLDDFSLSEAEDHKINEPPAMVGPNPEPPPPIPGQGEEEEEEEEEEEDEDEARNARIAAARQRDADEEEENQRIAAAIEAQRLAKERREKEGQPTELEAAIARQREEDAETKRIADAIEAQRVAQYKRQMEDEFREAAEVIKRSDRIARELASYKRKLDDDFRKALEAHQSTPPRNASLPFTPTTAMFTTLPTQHSAPPSLSSQTNTDDEFLMMQPPSQAPPTPSQIHMDMLSNMAKSSSSSVPKTPDATDMWADLMLRTWVESAKRNDQK